MPEGLTGMITLALPMAYTGLIGPAGIDDHTVRIGQGTEQLPEMRTLAGLPQSRRGRVVSPMGPMGERASFFIPPLPPCLPPILELT